MTDHERATLEAQERQELLLKLILAELRTQNQRVADRSTAIGQMGRRLFVT
jgi:hypothetical protein